jgi:hypothetical protein
MTTQLATDTRHSPAAHATRSAESPSVTQLKSQVAGMGFSQQAAALRPAMPIQMMAAVQMAADGFIPPAIAGVLTTTTVSPFTRTTQDPKTFTGSYSQYQSNWTYLEGRIRSICADPAVYDPALVERDIGRLGGKKDEWYDRWGRAALNSDMATANAEFTSIHADIKTILPEDKPDAGGGHLYTGQADTRGKADAQNASNDQTARTGVKHTSLEQTLIGRLFDDCAWKPPTHIQWNDTVKQWWSQISASFADTFEGKVTCHVNVGIPYFVGQKFGASLRGKPATEVTTRAAAGEFNSARELDKTTVFAVDEVNRLAAEMGQAGSKITDLELIIKADVGAGAPVTQTINIAPVPGLTAAQILAQIDATLAGIADTAAMTRMALNESRKP